MVKLCQQIIENPILIYQDDTQCLYRLYWVTWMTDRVMTSSPKWRLYWRYTFWKVVRIAPYALSCPVNHL